MSAPAVAIGRLATRIRAPGPEEGFIAGRLVREATERLGPALDRALLAAGFDDRRVVVLPRIGVRLSLSGTVSAADLAQGWAEAVARAILAVPATPAQDGRTDAPIVFRDPWEAEGAILRALIAGEPLPWWADSLGFTPDTRLLPAILARWVARDAIGAAWRMAALLAHSPPAALLPDARESAALTAALMTALRRDLAAFLSDGVAMPGFAQSDAAALAALTQPWRTAERAALAAMPADRRAPWIVALILARAPAMAPLLLPLRDRLEALLATLLAPGTAATLDAPRPLARTEAPPSPREDALPQEVWCGGLLLLIRPLARLEPGWLSLGPALPPRLMTLALIALRRLAAPLPPAARRVTLERDRALVALFAGAEPPDGPLEDAPLPHAEEAEALLARLLAAMPEGVAHAPGALRRTYGRDPFEHDRDADRLCRLLLRSGRLRLDAGEALLAWPLDHADPALRRAGWDLDPGWVPWLGRRVRFQYGAR